MKYYDTIHSLISTGELAPPTLRGMLGTLTQFALVTGILAADLFAFPFATAKGWRVLFSVTVVTAVIQLICAPFLLESPRWLLGKDPMSLRARYIIKNLRGLRHDEEVEVEVGLFVMGGAAQRQEEATTFAVLKEMLHHPKLRVLLFSSLVLQAAQQLSGINAVFYYSTSFFEGVIDAVEIVQGDAAFLFFFAVAGDAVFLEDGFGFGHEVVCLGEKEERGQENQRERETHWE